MISVKQTKGELEVKSILPKELRKEMPRTNLEQKRAVRGSNIISVYLQDKAARRVDSELSEKRRQSIKQQFSELERLRAIHEKNSYMYVANAVLNKLNSIGLELLIEEQKQLKTT